MGHTQSCEEACKVIKYNKCRCGASQQQRDGFNMGYHTCPPWCPEGDDLTMSGQREGHCYHPPCDLKCKPGYQLRGREGRGRCHTGGCEPDEKHNPDCLCCASGHENLHLSENECQKCMKGCDGYPAGSGGYYRCWSDCQNTFCQPHIGPWG